MKPAFRLDQHPRRPQPLLTAPPAGYFEQLPRRVMARLPQPEEAGASGPWLLFLPPRWRTSLAGGALLAGFAASFWLAGLGGPAAPPAPLAALDQVPQTELVGYLLGGEAAVEPADLAALTGAQLNLTSGILRASEAEISAALDAQPADDPAVL